MPASIAWALVAASFLLLGFFGHASITRSKTIMVFGAVISALVLNGMASQISMAVEFRTIKDPGTIQEDQMLPDTPGLMAGLIMFGWAFFLGGYFVGRLGKRDQTKIKAHQTSLLTPDPPPVPAPMTATTSNRSQSNSPGQA